MGCLKLHRYYCTDLTVKYRAERLTPKKSGKKVRSDLEYLPFGEALVEEHLSSYNSPFKFNAKEFDAETGNYYYGARYYNPKWSIWMSVDPLALSYPNWSPYAYTYHNPVRWTDSTGMCPDGDCPDPVVYNKETGIVLDEVVVYGKRGASGSAQGTHVETTDTGERFYGFKAEGQAGGKYGKVNGHISGFSAGYDGYTEPGGAHGSASAYGLTGDAEIRLGTLDNNISVTGEGSVFKAEISGDAGLYVGKNGKVGVELGGEAGAYALDGSVTPSFSILGFKFGLTIGGSLGSAHAGVGGAAVYDNRTGEGELSAGLHLGLGAGFNIGFSIKKNSSGGDVNVKK